MMKKKSSAANKPGQGVSGAVVKAREQVKAAKKQVKLIKAQLKQARAAVKAARTERELAKKAEQQRAKPAAKRKSRASRAPGKAGAAAKPTKRRASMPQKAVPANAFARGKAASPTPVDAGSQVAGTRTADEVTPSVELTPGEAAVNAA